MDTKGKSGSIWTMDEEMLLIKQSKLKDEELCGKLMADIIGIINKLYRGSPKPIFLNKSLSVMVSKELLLSLYTLRLGIIAFLSFLRFLIILDIILDVE